jgi:ABC-type nitrate/sulfonate/bicarbonate transport system substrate-binding protein
MLIQGGGKRVTTNKSVGALAPQVWAVRTEWAKSNPDALQKFLSAIDTATRQIEAARDIALEQLVLNLNIDKAVSAEVMKDSEFPNLSQQGAENYLLTPLSTDSSGLMAAVKRTADFLFAQGIIKIKVDANDLVDSEPLRNYLGSKK